MLNTKRLFIHKRTATLPVYYSESSLSVSLMTVSIGPKLIQVPEHMAVATKPKIVDFTNVDLYPSRYKYINGKVSIRSLIIEDINRQHDILKKMNTTVMIGDSIRIDIKFGHYENGEWIDLYTKGVFKVKQITPLKGTGEILMLVTEVI